MNDYYNNEETRRRHNADFQTKQAEERAKNAVRELAAVKAELQAVKDAISEYPLLPDDVYIGRNTLADKVTWLVRRLDIFEQTLNTQALDSLAQKASEEYYAGETRSLEKFADEQ